IIGIITLIRFFSPPTASTYLPATLVVSCNLHITAEVANLSVTIYMNFQGISSLCFGTLTDMFGRRPIYI
ncbi:hypothetical protein K437DRAFT_206517, partial [Tilletiaria anomala UBC 951]